MARKALSLSFLLFWLVVGGCTRHESAPAIPENLRSFSTTDIYGQGEAPQCKLMLDAYCTSLYSPQARGNLEVKRGPSSAIQVLQGETQNGFSQVYYRYAMAKIRNRRALPADLLQQLNEMRYFERLSSYLARAPRDRMSLKDRLDSERSGYELSAAWNSAVSQTVLARTTRKFPGYHAIPEALMPIELSLERRRIQRNLISEISKALWRGDKNWKKVEEGFERLQESFLRLIARLDVKESVRADWAARIREVKLVLPGSLPAIAAGECATTTVNAFYYSHLNLLTVCAGDFNSEDIIQTLAHEMAHSLGIDRSRYLFQARSPIGHSIAALRESVCRPEKFSCEIWNEFKEGFQGRLNSLKGFEPELPEFQRCLKRRQTSRVLRDADLERIVRSEVSDRLSELASTDSFLRITKQKIPYRDGKYRKNPNYLNPCSYSLWSQGEESIDDALSTLMFFTAEYRCSAEPGPESMKQAIEVSKTMTTDLLRETLRSEGEFSDLEALEKEGFASAPYERFSDVVGSYAMADYLETLPSMADRQNKFLASSSWQCLEPSLASHFPEESSVEKQYVFETHTEGDLRKKELFSTPIRRAIGCQKDFEFEECRLPLRK